MRHLLLLFLLMAPVQAAVVVADSCEEADVQAAYDAASAGDTVLVPPGSCSWSTAVAIGTKGAIFRGAGCGRTQITMDTNVAFSSATLTNGQTYRITGFQFLAGTGSGDSGIINLGGDARSPALRIDHNCLVSGEVTRGIYLSGWIYALVDSNFFQNTKSTGSQFIRVEHDTWGGLTSGEGSWSTADNMGTADRVVVENNNAEGTDTTSWGLTDLKAGARVTVRYNRCYEGCTVNSHGTESGGRFTGVRSMEVYGNLIETTVNKPSAVVIRGGTAVVYENTCIGIGNQFVRLITYRRSHMFSPWAACDGTRAWDTNSGAEIATGTHTGANGATTLTDSGAGLTIDAHIGQQLWNTTTGLSAQVNDNSATTISYDGNGGFNNTTPCCSLPTQTGTMTFNTGDGWALRAAPTACLDAPGQGQRDAISGEEPTPLDVNQAVEPVYGWDNVGTGSCAVWTADHSDITLDTDYFTATQKPGYTALAYPHPLAARQSGSGRMVF